MAKIPQRTSWAKIMAWKKEKKKKKRRKKINDNKQR